MPRKLLRVPVSTWNRLFSSRKTILGALLTGILYTSLLPAEVPQITLLSPNGLQQGTSAELTLTGKIGTLPVNVWASSPHLAGFELSEKGDKLTLTAAPETPPGVHWIRFYNKEGATSLLPLLVGVLPELAEKEPNNSLAQAQQIEALPVTINGLLHQNGEVDTFAVKLAAGETLVASIDAHASFDSPMDAVIQLLRPDGFVIAQNDDDYGFDPLLAFTAVEEGTWYVRVFCFPAAPNSTINFAGGANYQYRLTLTTGPFVTTAPPWSAVVAGWNLPESSGSPEQLLTFPGRHHTFPVLPAAETAQSVASFSNAASGPPVRAALTLQEPDGYQEVAVHLEKGASYRLRVRAREFASHLDPVLSIHKEDGTLIRQTDDASRTELDVNEIWKSPDAGLYRFRVSDRFGHAGLRYVARMEVLPDEPQAHLTVADERFTATRSKVLEIPVTVDRVGGFSQPISVQVIGLPPGVAYEPVVSAPKGDSAKKVTLKLDAKEADAFQGTFQIVGLVGEAAEPAFTATATLKVAKFQTSDLWMTIPE